MRFARVKSVVSRFESPTTILTAALLAAFVGLPAVATAQASFTAVVDGVLPVTDIAPVSVSGGDANVGGSASAGGVLKGEAHASAPAPNALINTSTNFGGQTLGHFDDIVITGPGGSVAAKLHVRFHGNLFQDFEQLTDGVVTLFSTVNQFASMQATLTAPGFGIASGMLDLESLIRAQDYIDLRFPVLANAEIVPTPTDPNAVPIDLWGFITQFSRQVLPITSGAYAGVSINEIDELKGEIILSLTVPVNTPLTLDLNLQQRTRSDAFYLVGANGIIDLRDTFGVPQDGSPVFELPDGYTANSPSLGIVNNVIPGDSLKCPQPQGYWKINPGLWPSSTLTLGSQTYSAAELMKILQTPTGSGPNADASLILARQLIAAKLNIANGSDPAPINSTISTGDNLLSGFSGKLPYKVKPSSAIGKQMTATASMLESYNLLQLTPNCRP